MVTACNSDPEKQSSLKENKLQALSKKFKDQHKRERKEAIEFAKLHKLPLRKETADGNVRELQKIENGIPMYYGTKNTSMNDKDHSERSTEQ